MIIKDNNCTGLYVDLGLFNLEAYPDTLKNVFRTSWEERLDKKEPILIFIKTKDNVVQLHLKGCKSDLMTPDDLDVFIDLVAKKYKEDINHTSIEHKEGLKVDKQIIEQDLVAQKIKSLEEETDKLKIEGTQ